MLGGSFSAGLVGSAGFTSASFSAFSVAAFTTAFGNIGAFVIVAGVVYLLTTDLLEMIYKTPEEKFEECLSKTGYVEG